MMFGGGSREVMSEWFPPPPPLRMRRKVEQQPHPTATARHRLERARLHCEAFYREADAFFQSRPVRVALEHDRQLGRFLSRAQVLTEPPVELSMIAGDAIHNLRAALDNLMWGFALRQPNLPIKTTQVYFPIFDRKTVGKGSCWDREGRRAVDGVV